MAAAASHPVSNVVFPKPAGAETSVTRASDPRLNHPLSRGRATTPPRSLGMKNLLSTNGPATVAPLRAPEGTCPTLDHAAPLRTSTAPMASGRIAAAPH